jgi:hypothetical protein
MPPEQKKLIPQSHHHHRLRTLRKHRREKPLTPLRNHGVPANPLLKRALQGKMQRALRRLAQAPSRTRPLDRLPHRKRTRARLKKASQKRRRLVQRRRMPQASQLQSPGPTRARPKPVRLRRARRKKLTRRLLPSRKNKRRLRSVKVRLLKRSIRASSLFTRKDRPVLRRWPFFCCKDLETVPFLCQAGHCRTGLRRCTKVQEKTVSKSSSATIFYNQRSAKTVC